LKHQPRLRHLAFLTLVAGLAVLTDLALGPAGLSPIELWDAFGNRTGGSAAATILWEIRMPRAVAAALVGSALAVSGGTFQALLRNPLAEPYILGISGGAALGAVTILVLGWGAGAVWSLPLAALVGALAAILIVFRVARTASRRLDPRVMILAGVVIGAFFNAAIMLILTFAESESLRSVIFWTMGSLAAPGWDGVAVLAAYVLPATAILYAQARPLNLLSIGEDTAAYLGTRVERVKTISFFLASFLAAACVAVAGVVGFVGLVVPHAVRLIWGSDYRFLLPASFLGGAAFLTGADAVARNVAGPAELPIGVVTAFVGVPFFVLLLRREVGR
jgi:iron complex transport system permease protein